MKDLHSHLLFGIDDGSKSLDESICLLKKMQEQNITDLICTPHYIENSKYVCNNKDKLKKIKKLKEKIRKENININDGLKFQFINFYKLEVVGFLY